jgi:hypothetical protein
MLYGGWRQDGGIDLWSVEAEHGNITKRVRGRDAK